MQTASQHSTDHDSAQGAAQASPGAHQYAGIAGPRIMKPHKMSAMHSRKGSTPIATLMLGLAEARK